MDGIQSATHYKWWTTAWFALFLILLPHAASSNGGAVQVRKVRSWATASSLSALTWSPDGQQIATASDFGRTLTIWSADGKREQEFDRHLNHGPFLHNSLAFLGNGKLLLTPPEAGPEKLALSVWDISTGKVIRDVPGPFPEKPFRFNEAQFFAVSGDESMVAVVSSVILSQPVTLYRTRNWSVLERFPMEPGPRTSPTATAVAFSPDGKVLAIGQLDGVIRLHTLGGQNSTTRTIAAYDPRILGRIESLAFSPDGKYLVSGLGLVIDAYKSSPAVKLWKLSNLNPESSYLPGAMPVRQISWSDDGNYIAIAAGDKTARIGSPLAHPKSGWISVPFTAPVMSVAFAPKRNHLAIASASAMSILEVKP